MRRLFIIVRRVEATILASSVIAMAAITIVNVAARNLFRANLAAAEELNQFLIVVICFVGLSYAASHGRHIRMTAVYDQLNRRSRKVLMVLIGATTAALMFFLAWHALSYARGVERISPVLGVPLRVVYLVAPLGLFLCGLQYLLTTVRNLGSREVYLAFDLPDRHAGTGELEEP